MTYRRPFVERLIQRAAMAMIVCAAVVGALSGLALMGVATFGPVWSDWAARRGPGTLLLVIFVAWPVLTVLAVVLEGLFERSGKESS